MKQWNLIRLREELGLNQTQFAERVGITASTYRNKEAGDSSFKDYEMFAISEFLNLPLEEIFLSSNCSNNAIKEKV